MEFHLTAVEFALTEPLTTTCHNSPSAGDYTGQRNGGPVCPTARLDQLPARLYAESVYDDMETGNTNNNNNNKSTAAATATAFGDDDRASRSIPCIFCASPAADRGHGIERSPSPLAGPVAQLCTELLTPSPTSPLLSVSPSSSIKAVVVHRAFSPSLVMRQGDAQQQTPQHEPVEGETTPVGHITIHSFKTEPVQVDMVSQSIASYLPLH